VLAALVFIDWLLFLAPAALLGSDQHLREEYNRTGNEWQSRPSLRRPRRQVSQT
jgi:hypothetical protein